MEDVARELIKKFDHIEMQLHELSKKIMLLANSINATKYPILRKLNESFLKNNDGKSE